MKIELNEEGEAKRFTFAAVFFLDFLSSKFPENEFTVQPSAKLYQDNTKMVVL